MINWIEWIGVIPLLGLTGNWRGYRMGGKAIGGASMSTDMKKKFEAARASGNMDQAKALADKAQKFNDDKKAEKAKAKEAKTIAPPEERRKEWMKTLPSSTPELKKFLGGDFTVSSKKQANGQIEVVARPSASAVKRYGDSAYRNFSHVGYGPDYQTATAKILEKFYPHLQGEWESGQK